MSPGKDASSGGRGVAGDKQRRRRRKNAGTYQGDQGEGKVDYTVTDGTSLGDDTEVCTEQGINPFNQVRKLPPKV